MQLISKTGLVVSLSSWSVVGALQIMHIGFIAEMEVNFRLKKKQSFYWWRSKKLSSTYQECDLDSSFS